MHTIVLRAESLDYSTMTEIGKVEISQRNGRVWIDMHGFEFSDSLTCREKAARVTAWLRDVLAAQLEAERLVPGGELGCSLGMS